MGEVFFKSQWHALSFCRQSVPENNAFYAQQSASYWPCYISYIRNVSCMIIHCIFEGVCVFFIVLWPEFEMRRRGLDGTDQTLILLAQCVSEIEG